MLRIHFSGDDLARVMFARPLPQAGEAVMAAQVIKRGDQMGRYGGWRIGLRGRIPVTARPLLELIPADGWVPDFLTPLAGGASVAATTEAILGTSPRRLTIELNQLATTHRLPGWVRAYAAGDRDAAHAVTRALAAFFDTAVAPYLPRVQPVADAEQARAIELLARRGAGHALAHLHPMLRWEPGVLMLSSPRDGDLHLGGRGLVLAPMVFCGPRPRLWLGDGTTPALLAYPTSFDPVGGDPFTQRASTPRRSTALSKLLGATRAKILSLIVGAPGLSTAELANSAGVSLASTSEHAAVLRQARLIISHRDGRRVRHYPTKQAADLDPGLRTPDSAISGHM